MGSGKTSYAIQMMQEAPSEQKFIYVTPYLEEVTRIKENVTNRHFKEPTEQHGLGTKFNSLKRLIAAGEDIATTHALFRWADDDLMKLLDGKDYILIVDEVMEVISELESIRKDDIPVLINSKLIDFKEDGQVIWIADPTLDTKYNDVKPLALAGNLYKSGDTALVWNFPAKVFHLFKEVYIMTYLFDGQLQKYYYDVHNIEYEYYSRSTEAGRYMLADKIIEDRAMYKALITIYEGNLNDIGRDKPSLLSKNWFSKKHNATKIRALKNNLYNYFRNITKAPADKILWTTFKEYKSSLKGSGFSRDDCFAPCNARSTNQYRLKTTLAYCLNRFMNPIEKRFFSEHNIKVDVELLALSDMLQWIFRSAIREGEPINIYIPSKRMRELLIRWLNYEI